jgi:hypothetical protein
VLSFPVYDGTTCRSLSMAENQFDSEVVCWTHIHFLAWLHSIGLWFYGELIRDGESSPYAHEYNSFSL